MATLILGAYPRDCCYTDCRQPTKDEIRRYDLAGDAPWFICNNCKLTHPYYSPTTNPERYAAVYALPNTTEGP